MKRASVLSPLFAGIFALATGSVAYTQTQQSNDGFENSIAIVDTKILFAIGAREAEQQLRGSFGWPTFQEGFVDGVYFRFDPDGYARFSSSARLDEDVFEVVCSAGTAQCIASKGALQIGLTPSGPVQVRIEGITPNDTFFITDRKSELPLPPGILGPLDARLETLLGSGGDLLVKREVEVIQTISLVGFNAVATYLRWVSQQQSPRVFPRGWPVPAQSEMQVQGGLTQPGQWLSPNAGPQQVNWGANTQVGQANNQFQQQNFGQNLNAQQPQTGTAFQTPSQGYGQTQALGGQWAAPAQQGNLPSAQMAELNQLRQTVSNLQNGMMTQGQRQPGQLVPTADLGQSFAQQAQGRELTVSSVAFDGFAGGGTVAAPTQRFGNTPQFGIANSSSIQQQFSHSPSTDSSAELVLQIRTLERDLNNLRTELNSQLSSIRSMIEAMSRTAMTTQATAPLQGYGNTQMQTLQPQFGQGNVALNGAQNTPREPLPRVQTQLNLGGSIAQQPQLKTAVAEPMNSDITAVERLLLNRLAQQEQLQGLQLGAASPIASREVSDMSVDRQMVEDILNELGGSEVVNTRPSLPESGEPAAPIEAKDGFVTLSDYINQLVTKDGTSEAGSAQ